MADANARDTVRLDDLTFRNVDGLVAYFLHPGAARVVRVMHDTGDEGAEYWIAGCERVAGELLGAFYSADRDADGFYNRADDSVTTFLGVARAVDEGEIDLALREAANALGRAVGLMAASERRFRGGFLRG